MGFMGKVYMSNKLVRSEGLGLNCECNESENILDFIQYFLNLGLCTLCTCHILSCLLFMVVYCLVYIVVVVLCVLLSPYVYVYYGCIVAILCVLIVLCEYCCCYFR
jgi:hypothetical protein